MRQLREHAAILWLAVGAVAGHVAATCGGLPAQACGWIGFLMVHRRERQRGQSQATSAWLCAWTFAAATLAVLPTAARPAQLRGPARLIRFSASALERSRASDYGTARLRVHVARSEAQLVVRDPDSTILRGSRVAGTGWLDPGRHGGATIVVNRQGLTVRPAPAPLSRMRAALVAWLRTQLDRHAGARARGLVLRVLLGESDGPNAADVRNHRRLGLAHLLAISGLHAVFVALLFDAFFARLCHKRMLRLWLLAGALVAYAWLTEFRAPVVRAVVGFVVWRWCSDRGHRFAIEAALSCAVLVTCTINPADVGSISFCLSYTAVAGLATLTPLLIPRGTPRHGWRAAIVRGMAASTAAQLATGALALTWFGYISPWGMFLNVLAIPIVLSIVGLGLLVPLGSALVPSLAAPLFGALGWLARSYLDALGVCATLPGAPLHARGVPPHALVFAILGIGALLAWFLASRRTALATCVIALVPFAFRWDHHGRSFSVLAVGHGQCVLAATDHGCVAVDCGDSVGGRRAPGRLSAALERLGRRRIEHLVLTHADADHTSGLPELLLRVDVGHVWLPESPKWHGVLDELRTRRIPFSCVLPGSQIRLAPGVRVVSVQPEGDLAGSNDGGLVVDIRFADGPRVVVMGDHEEAGTLAASRVLGPPTHALVLPHHGAVTPALPLLVAVLRPRYCIASTSRNHSLARYARDPGLRAFQPIATGQRGDVTLREVRRGTFVIETEFPANVDRRH